MVDFDTPWLLLDTYTWSTLINLGCYWIHVVDFEKPWLLLDTHTWSTLINSLKAIEIVEGQEI